MVKIDFDGILINRHNNTWQFTIGRLKRYHQAFFERLLTVHLGKTCAADELHICRILFTKCICGWQYDLLSKSGLFAQQNRFKTW